MTYMTHGTTSVATGRSRQTLLARLNMWMGLYRQRRTLARLDDSALRDLGLTRDEADAEAMRPIWDVPAAWRR